MVDNTSSNPATGADGKYSGTAGSDSISGGGGGDSISTGAGNDVISGDGPLLGQWTYGVYNRDFSAANGQAPTITQGRLVQEGYVDDFNVATLVTTARGTNGDQNDFGMVYRSTLNVSSGGTYRIGATSDDGSTVVIKDASGNPVSFTNQDGQTRDHMDNDYHQTATTRHGDAVLEPGQTYTIEVRFWENQGQNILKATIKGPDTGNATQNLADSSMLGVPPLLTGKGHEPGDDVIDAGAGSDVITTGEGNDFIKGNSFGGGAGVSDTVTDFDPASDRADMSGFYDHLNDLRANTRIVDGNAVVDLPDGARVTFQNITSPDQLTAANTLVPCFTPGATIDTPFGPRTVETLRAGDLVLTASHGPRPLVWVGRRDLARADLDAAPNLAPILIRRGALGPGLPSADLIVSPQHRVLLSGFRTQVVAGIEAGFAPAVALLHTGLVERCHTHSTTSYIHLMFDRHEVVFANGVASESLLPSRAALGAFGKRSRGELFALFPELVAAPAEGIYPLAHPVLTRSEARCIMAG